LVFEDGLRESYCKYNQPEYECASTYKKLPLDPATPQFIRKAKELPN